MISDLFEKRPINSHPAVNNRLGCARLYRRSDLSKLAREAYERGEKLFYCKPENPADPYSKMVASEPEYRWFLKGRRGLTDEEFAQIRKADGKKTVFDEKNGWIKEAEDLGTKISKALEPVISEAMITFTPESVHYIADTMLDLEIFNHVLGDYE